MALERVSSLLRHPNGAVLVNLMTFAALRHLEFEPVREGVDELFGGPDWKPEFERLSLSFADREEAFRRIYLERLRSVCGPPYVTSTRIRDPNADRTYFHLAYGTRHPKGIEVFRAYEKRCLELQERVAFSAFHEKRAAREGMLDLLANDSASIGAFKKPRGMSLERARSEFNEWLAAGQPTPGSVVAATIMQHPYVDQKTMAGWAKAAETAGQLERRVVAPGKVIWAPTQSGKQGTL